MIITVRTTAAASCLVLLLGAVRSQAADDAGASLSEIIVTATRVRQAADKALEPVVVIDREALQDSLAVDVGDLLRFHAGIDIGRTGGPGQPLSIFIRGANSDQSIVMIDGVRINSGTQTLAPLMNLAPELFDRIEVVKGPRSAIYGTDAIGGVVNLLTRSNPTSGADVMLGYGRYGTSLAAPANLPSMRLTRRAARARRRRYPGNRAQASPPIRRTGRIEPTRICPAPLPSPPMSAASNSAHATMRRRATRNTPTPTTTPTSPRSSRSPPSMRISPTNYSRCMPPATCGITGTRVSP